MSWSPPQLKMLLHYHCVIGEFEGIEYPAQQSAIHYFLENGFLTEHPVDHRLHPTPARYRPTEKLHVFCEKLCETPEPRQVWV